MCVYIRSKIADVFDGHAASKMRCLYGGSVNPITARDIIGNDDVDGVLVGSASLKPSVFADIVKAADFNS
jgi:triosephosphate isomerase